MRRSLPAVMLIAGLAFLGLPCIFAAEEEVEEPPKLLGQCSVEQLRERVAHEGELAAVARVMLERGDIEEGLKLTEINATLHRDSAYCASGLAEARLRAGDAEGAHAAAQRALRLNTDPGNVEEMVELLHRSRE